jgi:ATP-dependent RNA helicase DDX1
VIFFYRLGVRFVDLLKICICYFQVDIVVGTPGRMEDLISAGHLSLTQCRFFVLDEADGLLKQGYTELIDRLHRQIPKITSDGRRLQMIVCSATLHAFEVKKMAVSFPISRVQLV